MFKSALNKITPNDPKDTKNKNNLKINLIFIINSHIRSNIIYSFEKMLSF